MAYAGLSKQQSGEQFLQIATFSKVFGRYKLASAPSAAWLGLGSS